MELHRKNQEMLSNTEKGIEHQRNLKNYAKGSNVANYAWQNNHSIDFDNACVIDKGNYRVRKTLESWHTAKTIDAENNSKPLPRQYSILL